MKASFLAIVSALAGALAYPSITSPTAGVTWTNGETATITWDTTGYEDSTETCRFFVGRPNPTTGGYTVKQFVNSADQCCVEGTQWDISAGTVDFTLSISETEDDYVIYMYGSSGYTISDEFTIVV